MSTEPTSEDASDDAKPLSPNAQLMLTLGGLAVAVAVGALFFSSPMFKPVVATVALTGLEQPAERSVTLRDGRVGFGFRVGSCSYAGPDYIVIDVDLLRDGASVAHMRCRAFELEGDAGGGSGETHYNSDCQMAVPAGGATAVRAVASQEGRGRLTLASASVLMYRP